MNITQFSIEEVRCFAERQNFEIRPLTFLVGENSTGKTTMLACFQVLADYLRNNDLDFNCPPYSLGTFKDIVRNSKHKEKTFKLGFTLGHGKEDIQCEVEFVQKTHGVEPVVRLATLKFANVEGNFTPEDAGREDNPSISFDKEKKQYHVTCDSGLRDSAPIHIQRLIQRQLSQNLSQDHNASRSYIREGEGTPPSTGYPEWTVLSDVSAFSVSPIRSRPERTYHPTRISDNPEGSDVPMHLMELKAFQKEKWEALKDALVEFGKRSGLFQGIEVKTPKGSGGAFQLRVKVRGPNANVIDVGYGVSQILPILAHILDPPMSSGYAYSEESSIFLLQHPEVHLHPRVQAELSSLLATLAGKGKQSFIIETHSDYLLDRARIEIRRGAIRPEDVSFIYLEPRGRVVKAHNIRFDEMANMIDVPPHYGKFFLKETDRLMGFQE